MLNSNLADLFDIKFAGDEGLFAIRVHQRMLIYLHKLGKCVFTL